MEEKRASFFYFLILISEPSPSIPPRTCSSPETSNQSSIVKKDSTSLKTKKTEERKDGKVCDIIHQILTGQG